MDQLPNVSNNLINIRNKDVSTKSNQAWARLSQYYNDNKERKVIDAEGNSKIPNSNVFERMACYPSKYV